MKTSNCVKYVEHIHIIYEGGEVTMKYREDYQTLRIFKKLNHMVKHELLFQVLHGLNMNILVGEMRVSMCVCYVTGN